MTDDKSTKLTILITGGSSGIGKAIALEMAKEGHNFYLTGRNEEKLQQAANQIDELDCEVYFSAGDVANETDVERIYQDAEDRLGEIDVLVASAGVGFFGNLEDLTIDQYDSQMDVNVRGVFLWLKKVLPKMKERRKGQVIVISSNLGLKTASRCSIYAATKHAVQAMVSCLREELKGTMVKAATINPGSVDTPWFDGKEVDRTKMLSAEDVAKAARIIIDQSESSNIDHILLLPGKI